MSEDRPLHVGTTTADTDYHACRARPRDISRGQYAAALCGMPCRVTPQPWDEDRQARRDACRKCAAIVDRIWREEARKAARPVIAAGYIRASTDRQVESPDVQKETIVAYCRRNALPDPLWFIDPATSGDRPLIQRPAGREMLRQLRRGDHVVIARLDRLSRNWPDFVSVSDTWFRQGINLHPCDFSMKIVAGDPICEMVLGMLSLFARYERRLIQQRTREVKQHQIALGLKHNDDPPFGFRWERRNGKEYKVIDEYEAAICIKAVELTLAGLNQTQIAHYLNFEWGVRNPRALRHPNGKYRRRQCKDPSKRGLFRQQMVTRLVDRGLVIMQMNGLPLPDGVQTRKDLMLQ